MTYCRKALASSPVLPTQSFSAEPPTLLFPLYLHSVELGNSKIDTASNIESISVSKKVEIKYEPKTKRIDSINILDVPMVLKDVNGFQFSQYDIPKSTK